MKRSEDIKDIAKAIFTFNSKIGKIKKDSANPFFKSSYASLSTILDSIREPLSESGLIFSQLPCENNGLTTILIHVESGQYFESTSTMPVAKANDPQAVGSAITYARRYDLAAILGLNIDEDDDGNKAAAKGEKIAKDEKPWLNEDTDKFLDAVAYVKANGPDSIKAIKSKYRLSKETESKLLQMAI